MSALVLRRLPSGRWALVAVPDAQPVATERRPVPREEGRRLPFLATPALTETPS